MKDRDKQKANRSRLERAQLALDRGDRTITLNKCGWDVKTPTNTYRLAASGGRLNCSCEDYRWSGCKGIDCKHIQGVRMWQEQKTESEEPMNDLSNIIERLRLPLDMTRVKRRRAPGRGTVPFLKGHDVIETANNILTYHWSFDLLSEPKVMIWEQVITYWDRQKRERIPVVDPETGQPKTQRVGMVYITGKVTVELDGKTYTHADVGRVSFTGDTPEAMDTALGGASTDCLKRCFRQLGDQFGNSLYDKAIAKTAGTGASQASGNHRNGDNRRNADRSPPPSPSNGNRDMTVEGAKSIPCPVGSKHNPQWANMPLGKVMTQSNGDKMLKYLASDQFKGNSDPARQQAKNAARVLLQQERKHVLP